MKRSLTIVIPTHNRRDTLLRTLRAYASQTAIDRVLQTIVVDDGSTDGTGEAVAELGPTGRPPLRYLRQDCRGAASARNRGICEARGEIILFGDDDIIPCPTMVAEHLAWHDAHPAPCEAILGRVAWSPEVRATPFMEWLALDGVFTSYGHRRPGIQERGAFLSGNISLKRDFLLKNGTFDEDFRSYGFEDIELGHRLATKGLRVFYNPEATGYHYKRMLLADVWRRAKAVESSRQLFSDKLKGSGSQCERGVVRKTLRGALRAVLPPLAPVTWLFDTPLPLPWPVYRAFYFHYIVPEARKRLCSDQPTSSKKANERPHGLAVRSDPSRL